MVKTKKATQQEDPTPAEAGKTSTTPPVPGTTEDCAYCGHDHYKVDNQPDQRGHFIMPCPECNCELRGGTT